MGNIKRKLIDASGKVILLVDSSKLDNNSLICFAQLSDVDVIISDADLGERLRSDPKTQHIEFVRAEIQGSRD